LSAVLSYGTGTPVEEIQARLGCSRSCLMNWCQAYRSMGLEGLEDKRRGGNNARLTKPQLEDLSYRLMVNTPRMIYGQQATSPDGKTWTVEDLYKAIKTWYGVVYQSRASYYNLIAAYTQAKQQGKDNE
jgi:transposase